MRSSRAHQDNDWSLGEGEEDEPDLRTDGVWTDLSDKTIRFSVDGG